MAIVINPEVCLNLEVCLQPRGVLSTFLRVFVTLRRFATFSKTTTLEQGAVYLSTKSSRCGILLQPKGGYTTQRWLFNPEVVPLQPRGGSSSNPENKNRIKIQSTRPPRTRTLSLILLARANLIVKTGQNLKTAKS